MPNIAFLNYCNLQCPYCFANKFITEEEKQLITKEQLLTILDFLDQTPCNRIGIIGGEPTLHPCLAEYIDICFDKLYDLKNITIFSNGIYLDKYLNSFKNHSALSSLINLNAPNTMSESNYNSIIETLNNFEKNQLLNQINFGINIYPDLQDFNYIIELCKKYKKNNLRISYAAPTCQYSQVDKDEYYNNGIPQLLELNQLAYKNNIELRIDCNMIPACYFKEDDLAFLKKNVIHWKTLCKPVIDITPDFKATCCFGAYGLIDLHQFDNINEVSNYFLFKTIYPKREANGQNDKCKNCKKFNNLSCQGGCLAFSSINKEGG